MQPMRTMKTRASGRDVHERPSTRPDDGNAFVPDTIGQLRPIAAPDAEAFAEEFIGAATGGESVSQDAEDEVGEYEEGGPFIALDEDGKLPSEAEPFAEDLESDDALEREQSIRGARWAARGA